MKMEESKIEHWKSNIEQLDASNSINLFIYLFIFFTFILTKLEAIAFKYQFLCLSEKISMLYFGQF